MMVNYYTVMKHQNLLRCFCLRSICRTQLYFQRRKNTGGRVALLLLGTFGSIRKILGQGLLKTSLENTSGQLKICPDTVRRTVKGVSGLLNICPDSSKYFARDDALSYYAGRDDYVLSWYVATDIYTISIRKISWCQVLPPRRFLA